MQAELVPLPRLHLDAGLRYDRVGYEYDNHFYTTSVGRYRRPADGNVSYDALSPKLGFADQAAPFLGLFGSYRQSFQAPSEGQLFRQGSSVNTIGLRPIKAHAFELGLRGAAGGFDYQLNAYDLRVDDDVLTFVRPTTSARCTTPDARVIAWH